MDTSEIPLPLLGVKAKIDRAGEHFNTLQDEVRPFLDRRPYRFTQYFDPNLRVFYIYVEPTEDLSPRVGILIGDVLHNLRSALDHTICALARAVDPRCECTTTEFPIFTDPDEYRKKVGRLLRGVPLPAQAVIEELQPFNSGENPSIHILELLRQFSNIDKHRRLNATLGGLTEGAFQISRRFRLEPIRINGGPVEGRTEVAAFYVPRDVDGVVNMKVDGRIDVIINEGKGLWPDDQRPLLAETLIAMFDWIGTVVLPQLEKFVGGAAR